MFYDPDSIASLDYANLTAEQYIYSLTNQIPRKTEDGIPIRKLYVTHLPANITRYELIECFRQYGWIKSCWVKMEDKERRHENASSAIYAFVTFVNPEDAHRALVAPVHEKMIRGCALRASPADSWHQPPVDGNGEVFWGHKKGFCEPSTSAEPQPSSSTLNEVSEETFPKSRRERRSTATGDRMSIVCCLAPYIGIYQKIIKSLRMEIEDYSSDPVAVLNRDCLLHVFSYLNTCELVPYMRVNKRWQFAIQDYFTSIREFKTSSWKHNTIMMTTAVFRNLLQCIGASLTTLHIDHMGPALNDRAAHTIGKFCPNLEVMTIFHMKTKKWTPIIYGCKKLKDVTFMSCVKITDRTLMPLISHPTSSLESLAIFGSPIVTGLFISTLAKPGVTTNLKRLCLHTCYNLQPKVLEKNIHLLPNLTTLKLDGCYPAVWKVVPSILKQLPKLEVLSTMKYSAHISYKRKNYDVRNENQKEFCEALAMLPELKMLNVSRNMFIGNRVMKQLGLSCPKLISINIAACNGLKYYVENAVGITDDGLIALISGCKFLEAIDVSYLVGVTDAGLSKLTLCPQMRCIVARGSDHYSSDPFCSILRVCRYLKELDLCGSDFISSEIVPAACEALDEYPRRLYLRLGGTPAAEESESFPRHELLSVNVTNDRSVHVYRPDYEELLDFNSDDLSDDPYDFADLLDDEYDEIHLPNLHFLGDSFDGDDIDDDEFDVLDEIDHLPIQVSYHRRFFIV